MTIARLAMLVILLGLIITGSSISRSYYGQTSSLNSSAVYSDSWPTLGGNAARTGYSSTKPILEPRLLWAFRTGASMAATPIIYNGVVYAGAGDGYLYAVNQSDGGLIWRSKIGRIGFSTPAADNGAVYAATDDGYLSRIDAFNGTVEWRSSVGYTDHSILIADGRVYASTDAYRPGTKAVYALSPYNGKILWTFNLTSGTEMAYANGLIYVGSSDFQDAHIYALNSSTGIPNWMFQAEWMVYGGIAYDKGMIFGSTYSCYGTRGGAYALNSTTGELIWRQPYIMLGPPAAAYGSIFLSNLGAVFSLNETNGARQWVREISGYFCMNSPATVNVGSPVVAGGLALFGGGNVYGGCCTNYGSGIFLPVLYAFNATTGQIAWTYRVDGLIRAPPSVGASMVYFTTDNGTLYALGSQAATISFPFDPLLLVLTALFGAGYVSLAVGVELIRKSRSRKHESR